MKIKKKIIRLLRAILLITGFALIIFAFSQLFRGDFFRVSQVVCFDNHSPCQADLWLEVNSQVLGKNLIFLSPQKITQQIKDELVEIEEVKIEKKLPNRLIAHLRKRKPIAVVEVKNEYWQVDYQGVILTKLDRPTALPLIVSNDLSVSADGKRIASSSILASLDCLYKLLFKNIEVRRIEITSPQELTIYLKTGPTVLIATDKDRQQQVDSLQLILERTKIEGRQIKVIDLRFDKPVISNLD